MLLFSILKKWNSANHAWKLFIVTSVLNLQSHDFKFAPLKEILEKYPDIEYIKCQNAQPFNFTPLPFSKFPELQPHQGLFAESFVLKIPNGEVFSNHGWIKIDNNLIDECTPHMIQSIQLDTIEYKQPKKKPTHIKGKVAVITMPWDYCYSHWLYNILGRLALLEQSGIEYDWLYVASDKPYMKETFALWGIDLAKILSPFRSTTEYIVADELIVPSHIGMLAPLPSQHSFNWIPLPQYYIHWNMDSSDWITQYCHILNIDPQKISVYAPYVLNPEINTPIPENVSIHDYFIRYTPLCGTYGLPWVMHYLRNKFLPHIEHITFNHSKKVFISRTDTYRKMTNEDEVFALFEQKGFVRYILSNMSVLEQIALFNGADIIVGAHGTGLVNLLFCKPNHTTIVEIFQARSDTSFYYESQLLNLPYHAIQTMEFTDIMGNIDTSVPLDIIQNFINTYLS